METVSKNIIDILQLYELSMAIGNSNYYRENCDSFLKLLLVRKDYNACWIYSDYEGVCELSYSIPNQTKTAGKSFDKQYLSELYKNNIPQFKKVDKNLKAIAPIGIYKGCVAIFNLGEQGLLFIHNEDKYEFSNKELNQLEPLVNKFSKSLEISLLYKKREKLLKELKKQNQELNDYAHIVSHDLKSPLISVNALVNWVFEDYASVLDEKAEDSLQLILSNLDKMEDVINGVLKLSTIDKMEALYYEVDIDLLVKDILKTMHIPKHIKVVVEQKLPIVLGDKYKFQQVFQNLISNAINYNNKKEGLIEIGCKETLKEIEFFVKDNGIGIEERYKDKIFQIFQTLSNSSKSTGIGLSIVKKVVDFYDGDVWFESKINEGSIFYFKLKK